MPGGYHARNSSGLGAAGGAAGACVAAGGAAAPVFAIDVFACPRCGGRRRLVGVYTGGAPLQTLLERLGLEGALVLGGAVADAAARVRVTGPASPSPRPRTGRSPASVSRRRSASGRARRPATRAGLSKEFCVRAGPGPLGGRRGRDRGAAWGTGARGAMAKARLKFLREITLPNCRRAAPNS